MRDSAGARERSGQDDDKLREFLVCLTEGRLDLGQSCSACGATAHDHGLLPASDIFHLVL